VNGEPDYRKAGADLLQTGFFAGLVLKNLVGSILSVVGLYVRNRIGCGIRRRVGWGRIRNANAFEFNFLCDQYVSNIQVEMELLPELAFGNRCDSHFHGEFTVGGNR
jgi:hypothetical protein